MRKCMLGLGGLLAGFCIAGVTRADLVGGAYTTDANVASWDGSPSYVSIPNASLSGASTGQGQPSAGSGATYTCLSEIVTPTSSFKLGGISIMGSLGDTTANPIKMHLYTLSSSGGTNFFSSSDAFYFPGTDLLANGTGNGLLISAGGSGTGEKQVIFNLSNGPTTNDQPTLNAGTSYALEFWVPVAASNALTFYRNGGSPPDSGGQMMGSHSATDFSTSRNTIAALGLAGGSPRTGAVALYAAAVPEPTSLAVLGVAATCLVGRRRKV
jgi:PEP-CTERM motif